MKRRRLIHSRCIHRSHRLRLWCFRPWIYDSYCAKHNGSCFSGCDRLDDY